MSPRPSRTRSRISFGRTNRSKHSTSWSGCSVCARSKPSARACPSPSGASARERRQLRHLQPARDRRSPRPVRPRRGRHTGPQHHPRRRAEQDGRHLARLAGGDSARAALRLSHRRTVRAPRRASLQPEQAGGGSVRHRDRAARRIATLDRAVGYDPSSPQKDLSFSEVDNAGSAPKCVVTARGLRLAGRSAAPPAVDVDRHLRAARARLHHPSERRRRSLPGRIAV